MGRLIFWGLVLAGWGPGALAQVANDNIENRRQLALNETVTSNTTGSGCIVRRGCVDERLTGQCIQYQNDQWFEFIPPTAGRYFMNIGGQRCRDLRGVQLVVLTGQSCQPATYHVLSCTSLGTQDDVFVAVELQAGQPYLLDVDGYLEDFCTFTLQVSGWAVDVPTVLPLPAPAGVLPATSRVVQVAWALPDSLAGVPSCRVLRREQHAFRSTECRRVSVARNSYGGRPAAYAVADTLPGPARPVPVPVPVPVPGCGRCRARRRLAANVSKAILVVVQSVESCVRALGRVAPLGDAASKLPAQSRALGADNGSGERSNSTK